jgi:membrane-bound serine protease (ClpP class)
MNEKITNDAVAQIRAAAEKRGRNAEWAERAVRESVSITANEAVKLHVVDFVADNLGDLLEKIDGDTTVTPEGEKVMHLKGAIVRELEISTKDKFLKILTSPDIAFILFSIGGLGIMLELYNPGSIFPGVIGAIAMILALYSFSRLPINYAGIALIALGILLFILEIKIVSYGLLTVGGIVSFILGGFMLIDSVDPALKVSLGVLITVAILFALVFIVIVYLVVKAARKQPFIGNEGLVGKEAKVRKDNFVFLNGALWKAESDEELAEGDKVKVLEVRDLTLKVRRI